MEPEVSREEVCSFLWDEAVNLDVSAVEAYRQSEDENFPKVREVLQSLQGLGVSDSDIAALLEGLRYEAVFSTLRIVSENGGFVDSYDCLYEDLLVNRP